jgi:signal transduction histidine kinase/DNA-binding response OmpR family regulator/streptogramin lyase
MKQSYVQLTRSWWIIWVWFFYPGLHVLAQPKALPAPEIITDRQGLPQAFVPAIVQDRQGFIWMATRDGLARYDGTQFKVFQPNPSQRSSLSFAGITRLRVDSSGKIWISSERNDLDVFDPVTEQFTNFSQLPAFAKLFNKAEIGDFCFDQEGHVWIVRSDRGLVSFDRRTQKSTVFYHQPNQPKSISSNVIGYILSTTDGNLWLCTSKAIDYFDKRSRTFTHYYYEPGNRQKIPEDFLNGFYLRPNGDLVVAFQHYIGVLHSATGQFRSYPIPPLKNWEINTYFTADRKGTIYFARDNNLFSFTDAEGPRLLRSGKENGPIVYRSIFVDQSDVLWLGTSGNGVQKYDLRLNAFQTAPYQTGFVADLLNNGWLNFPPAQLPPLKPSLSNYNFRYTFDNQGRLWYNVGSSDLYRIDFKAGKTEKIPFPIQFENIAIGVAACPLTTDPEGRVWAFFDDTAYQYDEQQKRWMTFPHRVDTRLNILMFTVDENALWLVTSTEGLYRVDRKTGRTKSYKNNPANPNSLSSNSLLCVLTDPDDANRLWIGTFGSGICIFNKRTGTCRRLTQAEGLPNNVIYSVIPDQQGNIWTGTNKGLARINRRSLHVQNYTTEDGILADEFNRYHFLHLPDDRILMGGLEGITAFYPRQIQPDPFRPRVEITGLQINNKPALPGPGSLIGELPTQALDRLTLPHDQNFLTVEFSALQFNKHTKNRYRYQLVGLDNTWVESNRPVAVFTDLRPGSYTLRLNTTNTSGIWSPHVRTLLIRISPPWWATWWAYSLYSLIIAAIGYGLFQNYVNRLKLQQSVAMKEHEAEQLRSVDAMKTRFFTNVTHEFRTPLTLILSPMEQLLQQNLEPQIHRRISLVEGQARQLLRLINQLMDFSKLEANLMTLNESRGNPGRCIDQWLEPFRQRATTLGIELTFQNQIATDFWFDIDKLEQIVYNLVSNALKFTNPGGQIRIAVNPDSAGFVLEVTDTGIGIPSGSLPLIFNRYYQVETTAETPPNRPIGTGIGLALVKELVDSQQGQIAVESREGQGTTFRVQLPVRVAQPPERGEKESGISPVKPVEAGSDNTIRILLVEDNTELAQFITESLPDSYQIDQASNGLEGLNRALERMPDLVISDVMMPVMDGYMLCQKLKTDLRTSHIPVVLLTAKVSHENRIEGLTVGADDYITKPFHVQELQLRVRNLLEAKRRLRERVHYELTQPLSTGKSAETDPILEHITTLLETNLDNSDFRVEDFMRVCRMSRMSLHRKVKTLTGMSVGDFIRVYRLKRATEFLAQGHTVAETAYLVGFENHAHFSKMFRLHYQMSPSQFITQGKM